MVIPTYWTGPKGEWEEGDAVFDHPTLLNEEGTLARILESLHVIEDKHFTLIIIGVTTNNKYENQMIKRLQSIIKKSNVDVDTILFTRKNLIQLKKTLYKNIEMDDILDLNNYANIRNMCLFLPYVLDAEVAILIDDDEIFEDPQFVSKTKEFIGRRFYGNTIDGVAGYYLNEDNEYYDKVNIEPWMTYWDRFGEKREAFDKIIGSEPRLKKTPFAFGGAMVIHRNLMRIVPFDPKTTRGEDTDYVINARIFGFNFYLDNQLGIKHLPPPKKHPIWKRFREDIYRFLYDKSKFDTQRPEINLREIKPEDFDPYPGEFMKPDLGDKIFKTNIILALNYLADNDIEACKETIKNIYLARYEAIPHYNTFDEYLAFQKKWRKLFEYTKSLDTKLKDIIMKCRIVEHDKYKEAKNRKFNKISISKDMVLEDIELFKPLTNKELRRLLEISNITHLKKNEYLFQAGDINSNIYIILNGRLQILKNHLNARDNLIVTELTAGNYLNETSIFFDQPHSVSVIAASDTELLEIPKDKILTIIKENCELSSKLLWNISKELSGSLIKTTKKYSDSIEQDSDVSDIF
jgi:hypothetical protein